MSVIPDRYVGAMWLILEQTEADDYVITTGKTHSVREQCEIAVGLFGLDWELYVRVDKKYLRRTEVEELWGGAAEAREGLAWQARTTFRELVRLMLEHDMADSGVSAEAVTGA